MIWFDGEEDGEMRSHCFVDMVSLCTRIPVGEAVHTPASFTIKCQDCLKMSKAGSLMARENAEQDEIEVFNSKKDERMGVDARATVINRITFERGNALKLSEVVEFMEANMEGVAVGALLLPMLQEGAIKMSGELVEVPDNG